MSGHFKLPEKDDPRPWGIQLIEASGYFLQIALDWQDIEIWWVFSGHTEPMSDWQHEWIWKCDKADVPFEIEEVKE